MKEILIYTDDISNYGKYRSLIENAEINLSHRCNLEESIKHINHKKVDLVIIDLDVSKFTVKHLRDIIPFYERDISIIIVFNEMDNYLLELCIDAYEIEVVKKQFFNTITFLNIINKILEIDSEEIQNDDYDCQSDNPFCDTDNLEESE